ncbi:HET-domain-containing protein, partial [Eremomyces bilateralis CBS 781.70]
MLPEGEHLRVLKLEPGRGDDPLLCHLEVLSVKDAWRKYEAISYVWGNPDDTRYIVLDGHELPITTSLYDALKHFRNPETDVTLWADSVCIQQSNPPEKGRQVQLMGKIYEGAARVRVWLGVDK